MGDDIVKRKIQRQLKVDGGHLTVDVYGEEDGAAIVLIPGVMADADAWSAVAESLRGWDTVVVVNRRGRHPSGPLPSEYGLQTELRDAEAVLAEFSDVRTLFGWSYGGLIALHLANTVAVPHLIAYEPIMAPFGAQALPSLLEAQENRDLDQTVAVALGRVTGMPDDIIASLRADSELWGGLRKVSAPLYSETRAINDASAPAEFAQKAARIDLILGERNRGVAPYGTTFEDVARRTSRGALHVLPAQAHLAHLEAPADLAELVNLLHAGAA